MTKIDARETTKSALKKYSSDQLLKKLEQGKLLALSKEIAIEILEDRKVELPEDLKNGTPNATKKNAPAKKAVAKKPDAKKEEPVEKKKAEPKEKAATGGKREVSNENPKLKLGSEVKFEQRISKEEVTGTIVSFYDWTTKKGETKEAANISVEIDGKKKKFVKNVSALATA